MRPLRWVLLGFAVLLLALVGALAWLLDSQSGARWAANRTVGALGGKLAIQTVDGRISGPLQVEGLRYRDPQSGIDVRVEHASLDVALMELLNGRVHVEFASAAGVAVSRSEPTKKKESKPFSLRPPIDVLLDRFTLEGARLTHHGQPVLIVRRAVAAGQWTDAGIALRHLDLESPQGNVHLAGEVGESGGYVGNLAGRFNWRQGEFTYAGGIHGHAEGRHVTIAAQITAPFAAKLDATLEQRVTLPWRWALRVPQFDPRSSLMPGSSLESLAASLTGAGHKSLAEVRGTVTLNGERVSIEPLRVRLQGRIVKLEALTLIDPRGRGRLEARGEVRLEPKPFSANLAVQWRDVSLPPEWVGQPLATHGEMQVRGNPATFGATGQLALGPPGRLANVTFALNGTPRQIELQQLAIVEPRGRLIASGNVQLKPVVGWRIDAQANDFDPGSFVAGWPGRLNFKLASQGKLAPEGPNVRFDMTHLEGTLRRRPVSGRAALVLNPSRVISGTMALRSGGSVLRLQGKRGQAMNLMANVDVATLDDWLPDSGGRLNGRFHITGRWPQLAITGEAHARKLAFGESAVDAANVNVDVANPLHPRGTLSVDASALRTGGFEFTSLALQASGNEAHHTLALVAAGDPLSGELRITGSRREDGWAGSIEQLKLAATDVAQLALRKPARVAMSSKGLSISQSCLTGDSISVCLEAQRDSAGALQASYVMEHLPLALVAAVAKPDLPFKLTGVIAGRGRIRRSARGALFGEAHLASPSGGALEQGDTALASLLSYENFNVDATLDGDVARLTTSATLGGKGALRGAANLTGLQGHAPAIEGQVDLSIDDLAPVALFAPQLAAVAGSGEAHLAIEGALTSPNLTGSARALGLAAEIPMVGIKLRAGEFVAELRHGGDISLSGHVTSGDGRLEFSGGTAADGLLRVKARGRNFLAADIPAARVTVSPDLELTRDARQMNLGGTVQVPHAAIDLTKLPQGRARQNVSPDVVVIDDDEPSVGRSRSVPLFASIVVVLGDDVKLVGFGLDATLTGRLAVQEAPGEPTLGSGEIRVAGTYKAYGQDLTIQQGVLLYAASPLDNPQVNLVAVRTLPELTAKLTVTGSARRPLLSVSSDPAVSQTEALSYLVTGKPLDTLGTGEGDVVQSAARSLGGATGNLLAKNIGKRIGVDEIGIQNSTELGGSAFTVGQYLSPRLYLSYGVGLFEPGQVVTLRYRISDKVSLEASQGPINQRAGVAYKVEK